VRIVAATLIGLRGAELHDWSVRLPSGQFVAARWIVVVNPSMALSLRGLRFTAEAQTTLSMA
jgi:hypothetical protein